MKGAPWARLDDPEVGDIHVLPLSDLREHLPDGISCWCRPARDCDTPAIVIHNALDQRERYERGELKLQ